MTFRIALRGKAERSLHRLDEKLQRRINAGIDALRQDPFKPRPGADIKRLRGDHDQLRLRVGEHRVFYVVDGDIVYITDVVHRSHAYD